MDPSLLRSAPLARRWLYALKPASWPKVLCPALLGPALCVGASGARWALGAPLAFGYALATVAFLVVANDWADQAVDRIKRKLFPEGCSPKTIPDGILPASSLLRAAWLCAALMLLCGIGGAALHRSLIPLIYAGSGIVALAAYSLPPLRLNYRGGGELVEALGVGVVLPLAEAHLIGSFELSSRGLALLGGLVPTALASALASGLSDEQSDREGGKTTFTTTFGNAASRIATLCFLFGGGLVWAASIVAGLLPLRGLAAVALLGGFGVRAARQSPAAQTNAFAAQTRFKGSLHQAIWLSTMAWVVGLAWPLLSMEASPR